MFKFFRKRRQNMIKENPQNQSSRASKINRYLLYAVGEIFLVVIGILLALQINIWNEARKEKILENKLLEKIAKDIADDIGQYENLLLGQRKVLASLDSFIYIIRNPLKFETVDLDRHVGMLLFVRIFTPNKSAVTNLISSGKIDIIENRDLLEHILGYYNSVDVHGLGIDEAIAAYTRNQLGPYFMNFDFVDSSSMVSEYRKRKSLIEYHMDPAIDNFVNFKGKMLARQIEIYEKQVVMANDLLNEINEELKK